METLGLSELAGKPVGCVEWDGTKYDIMPIKVQVYLNAMALRDGIPEMGDSEAQTKALFDMAKQLGPGLPESMFEFDALTVAQLRTLIQYLDRAQSKQLGDDSPNPDAAGAVQ